MVRCICGCLGNVVSNGILKWCVICFGFMLLLLLWWLIISCRCFLCLCWFVRCFSVWFSEISVVIDVLVIS